MRRNRRNRARATEAFRRWARLGCPDMEQIGKTGGKVQARIDLMACAIVFDVLADRGHGRKNEAEGREIMEAVRTVYMAEPWKELKKAQISGRVTYFAMSHYVSERTVYYWLAKARGMWRSVRDVEAVKSLQ